MALHIIKLCVGVSTIDELAAWQAGRLSERKARGDTTPIFHATAQTPKRKDELLAGGSLYWVIKGNIQVRQKLIGFAEATRGEGSPCCRILLDPELVPVRPVPRRAFQGWRYLTDEDAPADLGRKNADLAALPPEMRRALTELGLI